MARTGFFRRLVRDEQGVAAIEMALVGSILSFALLNLIEVGRYAYATTQVAAASQAGAQASLVKCSPMETPVTINCPLVLSAVTNAVQAGSLGTNVKLKGTLTEGWYCIEPKTKALAYVSPPEEKPGDCADVKDPTALPALYLQVRTEYAYKPLFPGLTIVKSFSPKIERMAWMRLR